MKVNKETVTLVELTPDEGMHLQNKLTGEVHEDAVTLAKSLTVDDFIEITEQEYQAIKEAELKEIEESEEE